MDLWRGRWKHLGGQLFYTMFVRAGEPKTGDIIDLFSFLAMLILIEIQTRAITTKM